MLRTNSRCRRLQLSQSHFQINLNSRANDPIANSHTVCRDIIRLPPFDGPLPLVTLRPDGAFRPEFFEVWLLIEIN